MTMKCRHRHRWFSSNKGQGFAEFSIIVSLISIACIGAYMVFGRNVRSEVGHIGLELAGGAAISSNGQPGSTNNAKPNSGGTNQNFDNRGKGRGTAAKNNPSSSESEKDGGLMSYMEHSISQVAIGQYEDNPTALGTVMEYGLALAGADIHLDAINLLYDFHHWESTPEHMLNTTLDALSIIPVVGGFSKIAKKTNKTVPCFVSDTLLTVEDGEVKSIGAIDVGDVVMSEAPDKEP